MQISANWTASLARRLGLDANPLRRGTDRAEAWIRIALVLALLLLAVTGLLGHVLDRRRLAGWTQAWSAVEPQWTRRLH